MLYTGIEGRVYTRAQAILATPQPIRCQLPLPHLALRVLDVDTVLITYDSIVTTGDGRVQHSHRASIWSRSPQGWVMRFHQGTPFDPDNA